MFNACRAHQKSYVTAAMWRQKQNWKIQLRVAITPTKTNIPTTTERPESMGREKKKREKINFPLLLTIW